MISAQEGQSAVVEKWSERKKAVVKAVCVIGVIREQEIVIR